MVITKHRILLVDDEQPIRFALRDFLESHGYDVVEAENCRQAREVFGHSRPDAAIIDYQLGDGTAIELLPALMEIDAAVPLLVLTAHGSIDLAVEAIKLGAEQFLVKPIELPALLLVLRRHIEHLRITRAQKAGAVTAKRSRLDPFLGESPAIQELAEQARRLLQTDSPILIEGETGTGKSVLAAWLHRNGARANEPFVDLNCAGLSREFLETELFGHEKGAFTGAVAAKQGLLELAHRGTVFLDEIGDVDPQVQPKLLKVLEERRFRRLGQVQDRTVDINLIAATHQNLADAVRAGRFRSDLFYRISTIPLRVPALRERGGDVLLVARSLLGRLAADMGRIDVAFSAEAERALLDHSWPGNMRELRNVIERAMLLGGDAREIARADLRFDAASTAPAPPAPEHATDMTLQQVERTHIERVISEAKGRVDVAAARLGIPRSTLYQKLKTNRVSLSKFQNPESG